MLHAQVEWDIRNSAATKKQMSHADDILNFAFQSKRSIHTYLYVSTV